VSIKRKQKKPQKDGLNIRDRIVRLDRVPASKIAPSPHNWRVHPPEQANALRGVLDDIGFAGAVLARQRKDGTLEAIDGHLRLETMGAAEVPVLVTDLTEGEAKTVLATYDPLGAMATANAAKLDELLREVQTDSEAVAGMLADLAAGAGCEWAQPEPGAGGDEFDATPEASGPTRTQAGELWVIGGVHRLLVGDCTVAENVERLMGGEKALLCNTDPPYGVKLDLTANHEASNAAKGITKTYRDFGAIENDELNGEELQAFLEGYIRAAVPHLADNAAHYMWHPMLTQGTFFAAAAAAAAADILIHRQIVWVKPHFIFGRGDYHWQHELCFYGWRKGYRPEFYGERNQSTTWLLAEGGGAIRKDQGHPTQKPVELFTRPINNHTKPDELVYEPFAGSGSQFIAAHRLGRRCYGFEIEPRYADVILKRAEAEGLTCELADRPAKTRRKK
jgi:DNA modification methylase